MIYSHEYLWWGGEVTSKRLKSNKILEMFDFLLFWERICKNARRNTLRSAKDMCVHMYVFACACVPTCYVLACAFVCMCVEARSYIRCLPLFPSLFIC